GADAVAGDPELLAPADLAVRDRDRVGLERRDLPQLPPLVEILDDEQGIVPVPGHEELLVRRLAGAEGGQRAGAVVQPGGAALGSQFHPGSPGPGVRPVRGAADWSLAPTR